MILATVLSAAALAQAAEARPGAGPRGFTPLGYRTSFTIEIDASREEVFGAATGDVTGWWDHSFAENPAELVIEPAFGGQFYERFREGSDDGALHATVIYVSRPSALRMQGPLGLSGYAFDMVTSWMLEDRDGATAFTVELAMSGEVDAEVAGVVEGVWRHFIEARLKPYVEAGCHRAPREPCGAFSE
jgi:hypothetical protein